MFLQFSGHLGTEKQVRKSGAVIESLSLSRGLVCFSMNCAASELFCCMFTSEDASQSGPKSIAWVLTAPTARMVGSWCCLDFWLTWKHSLSAHRCPSYLLPCQVHHITWWPAMACGLTTSWYLSPLRQAQHITPSIFSKAPVSASFWSHGIAISIPNFMQIGDLLLELLAVEKKYKNAPSGNRNLKEKEKLLC